MALLFADAVAKYNSAKSNEQEKMETTDTVKSTSIVADFLKSVEETPVGSYNFVNNPTLRQELPQTVFMASVASEYYTKAKEDIANTKVGNKSVRKKNFKQVMQESFFYGSNRFGTNFIA